MPSRTGWGSCPKGEHAAILASLARRKRPEVSGEGARRNIGTKNMAHINRPTPEGHVSAAARGKTPGFYPTPAPGPPTAGVDVVFDPVGGQLLTEALKCVRWGAQILIIGFASGPPACKGCGCDLLVVGASVCAGAPRSSSSALPQVCQPARAAGVTCLSGVQVRALGRPDPHHRLRLRSDRLRSRACMRSVLDRPAWLGMRAGGLSMERVQHGACWWRG